MADLVFELHSPFVLEGPSNLGHPERPVCARVSVHVYVTVVGQTYPGYIFMALATLQPMMFLLHFTQPN